LEGPALGPIVEKLSKVKYLKEIVITMGRTNREQFEYAKKFLTPKGVAVTFQKNAWNALRSDANLKYKIDRAKEGQLKDHMKDLPDIPLLGFPPTRLSGPCSKILRQLLERQGYRIITRRR